MSSQADAAEGDDQYEGDYADEYDEGDAYGDEDDLYDEDGDYLDDEDDIDDMDEDDFLANNPAMQRVQAALRAQLLRDKTQVDDDLREKTAQLNDAKRRREDTGVNLYAAQQQLATTQMTVEKARDKYEQLRAAADDNGEALNEVKAHVSQAESQKKEISKAARLVAEQHAKLKDARDQLDKMKSGQEADVALARRRADKAAKGELSAEEAKAQQDLYVDRLQERVKGIKDERKILQTQTGAQKENTKEALARLNEAQSEVEAVQMERKEIASQWQTSLQGLTKRNEVFSMMQDQCNKQQQTIFAKQIEVDNLKKGVAKEHDRNETLEVQMARINAGISTIKKVVGDTSKKSDVAKKEYSICTQALHEAEDKLRRAQQEHVIATSDVAHTRLKFEGLTRKHQELEAEIVTKTYNHKTLDRYGKATVKAIKDKQRDGIELEVQLGQMENQTSRSVLSGQGVDSQIASYGVRLKEVEADLAEKTNLLREYENVSRANQLAAERKELAMSKLNREIGVIVEERMRDGAGKVDVTPAELERDRLQDTITEVSKDNASKQQEWLHRQSELVAIQKAAQTQAENTEHVNSKITVLSQKKFRISRDIEQNERELIALQRNYAALQRDVVKLDTLISENKGVQENLSNNNVLMESEFLRKLKEEELFSIQTQAEVHSVTDDKARILAEVVDAERQILQWEKKIQLAEEIKAAIFDPDGEGETDAMRKEIHRMQLRLTQLNRQRELLIQDMERSVERRGEITHRAKVTSRSNDTTTRTAVLKQIRDLQQKIKQGQRDAKMVEAETRQLEAEIQGMSTEKANNGQMIQDLADKSEDLDREYHSKRQERDQALQSVVYFQQLRQHVSKVRDSGKKFKRSKEQYAEQIDKQTMQLQALNNITEYLAEHHPQLQGSFDPIRMAIGAKLSSPGPMMKQL